MVFVISLYSITGGAGRSTLALATAFYKACQGSNVLLVDLDFEAPTQFMYLASDWDSLFELYMHYRYTISDVFRHILWHATWRTKELSLEYRVGEGVVNVIPAVPSVESVEYVAASWAVPAPQRVEHVRMLRDYLEGAAGKVGADTIIIDARSGLAMPSQDMLLASDLVVTVTPALKPQIARTLLSLTELFQVIDSSGLSKILAKYDLAKPFQALPSGWLSVYTLPWTRAGVNIGLDEILRYVSEIAMKLKRVATEAGRNSIARALIDAGTVLSTRATVAPFVRAISDASPFTMSKVLTSIVCSLEPGNQAEIEYKMLLGEIIGLGQTPIKEAVRGHRRRRSERKQGYEKRNKYEARSTTRKHG